MTIATILAFAGSTLGRIAIGGAGILAFLGIFAWQQQSIGQKKLVRASISTGQKINARNAKIRRKIYSGTGSVGSLPCRDC